MPPPHAIAPGPLPDRSGRLVALADQCVQCGLCLPDCPTYQFGQVEAESPRGRIALARAWDLEIVAPTAIGDAHLDHCLGCRRCEVVCPAGVQYGPLLVEARERQRERRAPGWKQRGAEWLTARPRTLRALFALYRHAYPLLPVALRPLPRPQGASRRRGNAGAATGQPADAAIPTLSPRRERIAVFIGCVAGAYEHPLRAALQRLCLAAGAEVVPVPAQTCCGSLHAHAGDTATAATLAARNRAAFADVATALTLASGCHDAVADALRDTVTTRDAIDFVAQHAGRLRFRATAERVALHLPCTQRNVVKSDPATRALLARVPQLDVVVLDAGFGCCGAAGTQMLLEPARAAAYRRPLLEQLQATGATRLLSANIGCRLHFANGTPLPVQHPLEFLAECLEP